MMGRACMPCAFVFCRPRAPGVCGYRDGPSGSGTAENQKGWRYLLRRSERPKGGKNVKMVFSCLISRGDRLVISEVFSGRHLVISTFFLTRPCGCRLEIPGTRVLAVPQLDRSVCEAHFLSVRLAALQAPSLRLSIDFFFPQAWIARDRMVEIELQTPSLKPQIPPQ